MEVSQARIADALERIADAIESIEHRYVTPDDAVAPADKRRHEKARRAAARSGRLRGDLTE